MAKQITTIYVVDNGTPTEIRMAGNGFTVTQAIAMLNRCPGVQASLEPFMVPSRNLMTGKEIMILPQNTPWCCNPASETYWSM